MSSQLLRGLSHRKRCLNLDTTAPSVRKQTQNASLSQSYRPVALLSCLSKVLERFVHEQRLSFLLESKALPDEQFGFLRGRSSASAAVL